MDPLIPDNIGGLTPDSGSSGNGQRHRKSQHSLTLTNARKMLILRYRIVPMNENTGAWTEKLYNKMKQHDPAISLNDVQRWFKTHKWIGNEHGVPKGRHWQNGMRMINNEQNEVAFQLTDLLQNHQQGQFPMEHSYANSSENYEFVIAPPEDQSEEFGEVANNGHLYHQGIINLSTNAQNPGWHLQTASHAAPECSGVFEPSASSSVSSPAAALYHFSPVQSPSSGVPLQLNPHFKFQNQEEQLVVTEDPKRKEKIKIFYEVYHALQGLYTAFKRYKELNSLITKGLTWMKVWKRQGKGILGGPKSEAKKARQQKFKRELFDQVPVDDQSLDYDTSPEDDEELDEPMIIPNNNRSVHSSGNSPLDEEPLVFNETVFIQLNLYLNDISEGCDHKVFENNVGVLLFKEHRFSEMYEALTNLKETNTQLFKHKNHTE